KNKITAANYILSRTFLSRSGVMRTLAKLKQLGAIQLHRGILVTMNQLPPSLKLSE
ncbi:TPA: helix-turn-helix domain-containing protein, partial [Klebsiella michiganensis]|nr:helix-turn-helix domain-containing protein [Klebsiella michiganensis]